MVVLILLKIACVATIIFNLLNRIIEEGVFVQVKTQLSYDFFYYYTGDMFRL